MALPRGVVQRHSTSEGSNEGREGPKEIVEGRPLTKRNREEPNPHRTPSRESGPSGLDRVRQAAKGDKKLRFTALLHDVKIDRLGSSYASLKSERRQKWMG